MINNFMCEQCDHYMVCDKVKHLIKFHDSSKKNLGIAITMDGCTDYTFDDDEESEEN